MDATHSPDNSPPPVPASVRKYLSKIGSVGGSKGSVEDKKRAAQVRIDKYGLHRAERIRASGLSEATVQSRLRRGWSEERALSEPVKRKRTEGEQVEGEV